MSFYPKGGWLFSSRISNDDQTYVISFFIMYPWNVVSVSLSISSTRLTVFVNLMTNFWVFLKYLFLKYLMILSFFYNIQVIHHENPD